MFYAELDENNISRAISSKDKLFAKNQIEIDSWDIPLLVKRWNGNKINA